MTSLEIHQDLWLRKTNVRGIPCDVVCVMICIAPLTEHRLVTDRQTDRQADRRTQCRTIYSASIASRGKKSSILLFDSQYRLTSLCTEVHFISNFVYELLEMILVVLSYGALKTSIPTRIQDCCRQRQRQYSRSSRCRLFPKFHCNRLPDVPRCLFRLPI